MSMLPYMLPSDSQRLPQSPTSAASQTHLPLPPSVPRRSRSTDSVHKWFASNSASPRISSPAGPSATATSVETPRLADSGNTEVIAPRPRQAKHFDLATRRQRLPRRPHTSGGSDQSQTNPIPRERSPVSIYPISPDAWPRRTPGSYPQAGRVTPELSPSTTPTSARTPTPTLSSPSSYATASSSPPQPLRLSNSSPSVLPPVSPSPTRARSMSDLLYTYQNGKSKERGDVTSSGPNADTAVNCTPVSTTYSTPQKPTAKDKRIPNPSIWVTLDDLVDRLLFLSISGDDAAYCRHFLLVYRRFACPRSILLGMQRRMRSFDADWMRNPPLAGFGQQRICAVLQDWMKRYPHDFAVPGTEGALDALVKSVARKTHLLHFAMSFHEFQQSLPRQIDTDISWAKRPDELLPDDSDDSYSMSDDDDAPEQPSSSSSWDGINDAATSYSHVKSLSSMGRSSGEYTRPTSRMRKSSLPFTAMDLPQVSQADVRKSKLKVLHSVAEDLQQFTNQEIAEEITRICVRLFLGINPRHWLKYTFEGAQKSADTCPVIRFNRFVNRLGDWVTSLILCHDKPRSRARQMEKFVEVASALRRMNNYTGLRAVIAGINLAADDEDPAMDAFKHRSPELSKQLQSWDVLLSTSGNHKAYRLALKNTPSACVPALEIHLSDLLRSQEGNKDVHDEDPRLIHWAKFNLIAKCIDTVTECQDKCRKAGKAYAPPMRARLQELVLCDELMDEEMKAARRAYSRAPPAAPLQHYHHLVKSGTLRKDDHQTRIIQKLQKLHDELEQYTPPPLPEAQQKASWITRLFPRHSAPEPSELQPPENVPKGLYLYGDVGTGKTMLMDLFYNTLPLKIKRKRRVHFHAFMIDVHKRLHAAKAAMGHAGGDPLPPVARDLAEDAYVLCFDEFQVTDIADAMILRRLFESLLNYGVVCVITSNRHPDELYKNGIQRSSFVPCIELLKTRFDVTDLDSGTDYRRIPRALSHVYYHPLSPENEAEVEKIFRSLAESSPSGSIVQDRKLSTWGRTINVPESSEDVAKFTFDDLCGKPLSSSDYLEITKTFKTVFVLNVPKMDLGKKDMARRFITFIDACYENKTRLFVSSEVPITQVFSDEKAGASSDISDHMRSVMDDLGLSVDQVGTSSMFTGDEEIFAFARCCSRLVQMGTREWAESAGER
ncbi:hypothetical protein PUNSTDRAFT_132598 [Punctularia strigosozonata HHB-11173 SS5]|uniref:uncharacterized protein n=1 Tax=Punctularia strigosozonata (strain HHB-11173) TaxID=741275 RepID=UPI00044176FE|nr:uncharacterized protein PUNSTDRAFT_132598 [Punctularia strigosozonata HHB-11173 SS5]EIN10509.1 hypothetical protein PUNSTDRAFT_132598 [Punctularia strigosozonata HHB-11173 SS5]